MTNNFEIAKRLIPWGSQTRSKSYKRFPDNYPKFVEYSLGGCFVKCDNGQHYLDFISALGAIILGYRDYDVDRAVISQISRDGNIFSLPHGLEAEVAELLCDIIPCAEMVLFMKNGGDATMAAVRLARMITGRMTILNKGYHGWAVFDQTKPLTDLESLIRSGVRTDVAAILIEPELFNEEKLSLLKSFCKTNGSLLIFDEVISGFRYRMGGMQEYYGVKPDLACFSKAMANGYPISALVGGRDLMERLERDIFVSSTFGGDTVGLAAAKATIEKIKKKDCIAHLWRIGTYLRHHLVEMIRKHDFPMKLYGLPPMIHFKMPQDYHVLFLQETIKRRIMIYNSYNLTYSHTEKEIDMLLSVYDEIFPLIREGKVNLEGSPVANTQLLREYK